MSLNDLVDWKRVRAAWDMFNHIPAPTLYSSVAVHRIRAATWLEYTRLRDIYLYQHKIISLTEYNTLWCKEISKKN